MIACESETLADALAAQGKLPEAEVLYARSIELMEKAFGAEHPALIEALEDYAVLLRKAGREAEAESLGARVRAIRKVMGVGQPSEKP